MQDPNKLYDCVLKFDPETKSVAIVGCEEYKNKGKKTLHGAVVKGAKSAVTAPVVTTKAVGKSIKFVITHI